MITTCTPHENSGIPVVQLNTAVSMLCLITFKLFVTGVFFVLINNAHQDQTLDGL